METFTVPVGEETIGIRTVCPERIGELRHVSSSCAFVKPGATFIVRVDGHPIVIAIAKNSMIFGHESTGADIVDEIVRMFQTHGVPIDEIVMCAQFATPNLESGFIERAREAGLRHVWAMNSLERLPNECEYIALHRRGCYH